MNYNLSYLRAYRRLKDLFQSPSLFKDIDYRMQMNPPKQAFELGNRNNNECITTATNVMCAKTENGIFTKIITIDDVCSKKEEQIAYTDNLMNTYTYHNLGLTTLRCGMMATLSVELNNLGKADTKVGFIGNGAINQKTAELLNAHFGIHNFVIRGSKGYRDKNIQYFRKLGEVEVDKTESLELLNKCDVVICCTNSCTADNLISNKQLSDPKLIIAQDSGYVLDESFRKEEGMLCYTDHPEQIVLHYKEEFPFDQTARYFSLLEESYLKCRKSVYLYGIAMADAIVFEEIFKE